MGKQALVIGGTGFLGCAIVEELIKGGWEVSSLGRGNKPNHSKKAEFIQADRSIPGAMESALNNRKFDLVVDCAAYNQMDAEHALNCFRDRAAHYILISTDYVYAAIHGTRYPITEQHPTQEELTYSSGKLDCEKLLLDAWHEYGFPVTVLRPPHILGAGRSLGCDQAQGRDAGLLHKIRQGEGLVLVAEGQMLIQPVWNREIGACIVHIAGQGASFGEIFHCTGPDAVTAEDYYRIIADYLSVPLVFESMSRAALIQEKPNVKHHTRHRLYDTSLLQKKTGYIPQYKLQTAIHETIEWMEQQLFSQ
ncbi:NAD-dependent epimerase/dehydratase family protein [Paenibacillus agricola]|uniref:NAD-dependent epimerase/dehydratase family protein n=1 Tax=Paenibacillus agricola TaxID=2716264 RepID=A0ABX0J738_9BACL|nr:NAD-dependent epimerase/dehydratase family protein [Paenibacillus agricola]NHN31428.1 NAD-dependent epimerase/dehydratase family protein [Paenibacillus agricola]